ncbi:MAG: T9SS type A sorting domain-containing protein [Ignavibacteriales bacterium]
MQKLKYFLLALVCTVSDAQTVYELTPGSKNNLFDLSLSNNTAGVIQSLNLSVEEAPEWIEFKSSEINIDKINKTEKPTAEFYFNISENAIIGEIAAIKFSITDQAGRNWLKSYNVKVTPPKVFEVFQNYPNPFNPSTTIKYSIPQDAFVAIKVFNVLGEEISDLVNKEMKTGVHEEVFDATNFSSGFYFYIVEAKGTDGTKYIDTKKMILLR